MITIENSHDFSQKFKELVWSIFFESKGRGISLQRHFPWLYTQSLHIKFFEAREFGQTVGGLALKEVDFLFENSLYKVGLIGLVCVDQHCRGRGIARNLLQHVIEYSAANELDYLTLWTGKHGIYSGLGFEILDRWNYGWISHPGFDQPQALYSSDIFPGQEDLIRSLPPFAKARFEVNGDFGSIVYVSDDSGLIVTDYSGDPTSVGKVLLEQFPEKWRINFIEGDPLINVLDDQGLTISTSPTNLQMWLALGQRDPSFVIPNSMFISVLDRI